MGFFTRRNAAQGKPRFVFGSRDNAGRSAYLAARPWVFATAFLGYTGAYLVRNNLKIALPAYLDAGWTLHQMGAVLTSFTIAYGVGKVVMGLVVDRLSLRLVYAAALAMSSLLCMSMAVVHTPLVMGMVMVANGLIQGALAPAALAMIGAWYPNALRASRVALWNPSQNLGAGLLPLLIGVGAGSLAPLNTPRAYLLPGALGLLIAAWVWRRGADRPWREGLPTLVMLYGRSGVPDLPPAPDSYWLTVRRTVLTSRPLMIVAALNTALYCIRFGVINWLTMLHVQTGARPAAGEQAFAILEFSAIPASIIFAWIALRRPNGMSAVGAVSMVGLAAGLVVWPSAVTTASHLPLAALLGALMYGPQVIVNMLTLNLVHPRAAGIAVGVVGAAGYLLGESAANLLIPTIVALFSWEAVYIGLGLLAVACAGGYWSLRGVEARVVRLER